MRTLRDPLRKYIAEKILAAVDTSTAAVVLDQLYDQLVEPPNPEMADLAFGCFPLAKAMRKGPPMVAQDLKARIGSISGVDSIEAVGPYLNFKFSAGLYGDLILSKIRDRSLFKIKLTEGTPRSMIEYSQPNTHKEMHVGHMRNASLGDALIKINRYAGVDIISSTFPGDVGAHVAKCLWYMKYHNTEPVPATGKGEWLGRMYSTANMKLEDELGTPKEEENRKLLTEILKQLEAKSGEFYDLWKETREWSIALMKKIYAWAGVEFDQWYWESDVDSDSVKYVKQLYAEGKLIESQGAIGMNLEDEKLGFCLLLKSDGTGLYASKDLELARRKFLDFKIEKSIYIVDVRQELHFKQVFKVLERLGFPQAKDCFHLKYNFVELPDGAMSSRKGNVVILTDLIEKMIMAVKTNYLQRYKGEWSDADIDLIANQVAKGAIKYGMVRMDTNKKIVFEMDEWLKIEGESGPFVQYSYARVNSLKKKLGFSAADQVNWNLLSHPAEKLVMQSLINFHSVVVNAAETYRASVLCTYVYEVAKRFNYFYHECPIGTAETAELKTARLALADATAAILEKGLELLGIPAPEKM
jgi:arginyl-tRNA synthetase